MQTEQNGLKRNKMLTIEVKEDFDRLINYDAERDAYYFARRLRVLLKEIPTDKNIHILDFGGGSGLFSLSLQKRGYKNIYLVDFSETQTKLAQEKGLGNVYCGDEDYLIRKFKSKFFDFILMMDVIEHLQNPYETLKKIKRVMKPGCKLLITYPNPLWLPLLSFLGGLSRKLKTKEQKIYFGKLKQEMSNDFLFTSYQGYMFVSRLPKIILGLFEVIEKLIPRIVKRRICILNVIVLCSR